MGNLTIKYFKKKKNFKALTQTWNYFSMNCLSKIKLKRTPYLIILKYFWKFIQSSKNLMHEYVCQAK